MHARMWFSLVLIAALMSSCADEDKRRINGALCEESGQCTSGLCHSSTCLDPASDDDGDGLINAIEAALDTHAQVADTDGDGIDDGVEVGDATSSATAPDLDQDGIIDALESASLDSDCDGVADQADNNEEIHTQGIPKDDDEDGLIDRCATDTDKDGIADEDDNCPDVPNPKQKDTDGDGVGDLCPPDQDGDGYSAPEDCNDADPEIHPGQDDLCDPGNALVNNDCDSLVDEDARYENSSVEEPCEGIGACGTGKVECSVDGVPTCSTNANGSDSEANEETCNDLDDDCDGEIDEGVGNVCGDCGEPPEEICNGLDDDCDGEIDEGVLCDDQDPCTHDTCSPLDGCSSIPIEECCQSAEECDDGLACTKDACDAPSELDGSVMTCSSVPHPKFEGTSCGEPCSDAFPCATQSVCYSALCEPNDAEGELCDLVPSGFPLASCNDSDGDGYTTADGDCDDANPKVNPTALEADQCDGLDANCDGIDGDNCCASDSECKGEDPETCQGYLCQEMTCVGVKIEGCCVDADGCNDGLACTEDLCKGNACVFEANHAACEDNDPCTVDTCSVAMQTCGFSNWDTGDTLSGKVEMGGAAEQGYGGTAWNTDGQGPEPQKLGHDLAWMCSPIPAFHYLASRDYDGIDADSPGASKFVAAPSGFLTFTKILNSQGKSLEDVTFHFGLMSLGEDAEIPGWSLSDSTVAMDQLAGNWAYDPDSNTEIRVYQPVKLLEPDQIEEPLDATIFELRLGGELMVRGAMNKVQMLVPYMASDGCMFLPGTDILGETQMLHPTDQGLDLAPEIAAAAAAFLMDVGEQGFYIEFKASVTATDYFGVNGRTGSHIDLEEIFLRSQVSCGDAGFEPPGTP